jgi:hypothetical protein
VPAILLKKLPAEALPDNKSCKRSASSSPIESGFRLPCSSNLLGNSTVSSESEPSRGGRSYLSLKSCEAGSRTLRLRRLDLRSRSWRRDEVTVSSESEYERRSSEPARRCSCGNSTLESRSKRTRLLERAREEATDFGLIRPSVKKQYMSANALAQRIYLYSNRADHRPGTDIPASSLVSLRTVGCTYPLC